MCGRIVQKSGPLDYVERIFPNPRRVFDDPAGPRYNIPPGTRPMAMHRLAGDFELARLPWGWRPTIPSTSCQMRGSTRSSPTLGRGSC